MYQQDELEYYKKLILGEHDDCDWKTDADDDHGCAHKFLAEMTDTLQLFNAVGLITTGEIGMENDELRGYVPTQLGHLHQAISCAFTNHFAEVFKSVGGIVGVDDDGKMDKDSMLQLFAVPSGEFCSFINEVGVAFMRLGIAFVGGELAEWDRARLALTEEDNSRLNDIFNTEV